LTAPGQAFDEAMKLANQVTLAAPLAVYASRKVVLAAAYADDETLKNLTTTLFAGVMQSDDTKEGLTAFIEKRAPNWKGR
jgi:enoyl-CoA hydratase